MRQVGGGVTADLIYAVLQPDLDLIDIRTIHVDPDARTKAAGGVLDAGLQRSLHIAVGLFLVRLAVIRRGENELG